ncbi:hypothetical protein AKJ56_00650 [candidate division MSBL1 archaeon SCGC-AAA382N08]|uniref:FAD-binding PCMH-type domain-containing protein n=1 Tax=candidate division MSBL1 archaeon SCGC-AAA382N08 TaxID=1698285 RepID=A0A133VQD6_9EURY|nr:hypothetical protein AKJ56_00650 [candidate division MSBL1 archaeon SCGC-AAA382N08]
MSTEDMIQDFVKILDRDRVITDVQQVESYLIDETPDGSKVTPEKDCIVIKPKNVEELSEVLSLANSSNIPVFVRGGATGLVSGCVPTRKGVILSMELFKKINTDRDNLSVDVGAGVTLEELTNTVEKKKLSFPLHPGDDGAQIGGLVANNAGGAKAVKSGEMRNFVKGLKVVLPSGEIIETGGNVVKDNTSASKLMHLFIGTEGIFGIIAEATLKVVSGENETATMVLPFDDRYEALEKIPSILRCKTVPQGLEYVERRSIEKSAEHLGKTWPISNGEAFLILIFSEPTKDVLYSAMEDISKIFEKSGDMEPLLAEYSDEEEKILEIRSGLYSSLQPDLYEDLDVCVPVGNLSEFLKKLENISEKYETYFHPYGHAGDGNLHIHIMKNNEWSEEKYESIVKEIYKAGVSLGGTITGEHGIGELKKKYLSMNMSSGSFEVLKDLKKTLDPNLILNPGKVVDID